MVLSEINSFLFFAINSVSNPFLDLFFVFVSFFGSPVFWIIVSALLFWKGEEKKSFYLMNLIVIGSLLVSFLKIFFKSPRPTTEFEKVKDFLDENFFVPGNEFSFPSGHATAVSSAFGFFYKELKKNSKIIFGLLVFLVLVSRVYLGKHFPIDVVAGLFLGIIIALALQRFNEWFSNTPARRELGFVIVAVLFVATVFLFESLAISALALGYYVGIFLFKELGFDSTKVSQNAFFGKAFFGLAGLFAVFLVIIGLDLSGAFLGIVLFFGGLWTTLVFPFLFEIIALKKKTTTK